MLRRRVAVWVIAGALAGTLCWAPAATAISRFDILYQMGVELYDDHQYVQAVKYLEQALAMSPSHAGIHHELGINYDQLGKFDLAIKHLKRAVELADLPASHWSLGVVYERMKQWEVAGTHYRNAIDRDNEGVLQRVNPLPDTYFVIGRSMAKMLRHEEALLYFLEDVKRKPNLPRSYEGVAGILIQQDKIEEARYYTGKAIELGSSSPATFTHHARVLFKLGQREGAIALLTAKLQQAPKSVPYLETLAWMTHENGDFAAAEGYLRQALAIDPKGSHNQLALGVCLMHRHRWPEAEEQFDKAILLDPGRMTAYELAAAYAVEEHQFEAAKKWYRQQMVRFGKVPSALYGLAVLHEASNDMEAARGYIELAMEVLAEGQNRDSQLIEKVNSLYDRLYKDQTAQIDS